MNFKMKSINVGMIKDYPFFRSKLSIYWLLDDGN